MSMTIDDAELIRSFKSGHLEAFDAIVAEHQAELLRHARRRTNDASAAEDLVQEAFIRAFRAFDRLEPDSRVRPWLHQILANVCIDEANRRRRDDNKTRRFSCDASLPLAGPSIEQQLGLHIDDSGLESALAALPDTHRNAFTMRFVDELDYDEIAVVTGVTEPNARARVSRARSAIRRSMQGAAAIPMAIYFVIRRPGRNALAAPALPDPVTAMRASESVGAASRMAVTLQPAIDAANSVAVNAPAAAPLLTKAAIGIGALAVTFSAAPEGPVERPAPIVAEAEVPLATVIAPSAPIELNIASSVVVSTVAAPITTAAPALTAAATATTTTTTVAVATTIAVATTVETVPATVGPVTTSNAVEPVVPVVSAPASTVPPTALPPLTGGSLVSSVSVAPAGPRLDLSGSVTLQVADSSSSGSMTGRIGAQAPDPNGSYRIEGTLTVQLESGPIDIRIAAQATSPDASVEGTTPTNLTMSGVYRASGSTGRLALSGNVSGSLSSGTLTLTLSA